MHHNILQLSQFFRRKSQHFGLLGLMLGLLTACASPPTKIRVVEDQLATDTTQMNQCLAFWQLSNRTQMNNATYWLNLIECSRSLSYIEIKNNALLDITLDNEWSGAFKRSILLTRLNSGEAEQQQLLTRLLKAKPQMPSPIATLLDLWVTLQQQQLLINGEKKKYQQLKEANQTQTKAISSQQQELTDLRIKLKNITEIERQLPALDNNEQIILKKRTTHTILKKRSNQSSSMLIQPHDEPKDLLSNKAVAESNDQNKATMAKNEKQKD